jgi:hypothetical protein
LLYNRNHVDSAEMTVDDGQLKQELQKSNIADWNGGCTYEDKKAYKAAHRTAVVTLSHGHDLSPGLIM